MEIRRAISSLLFLCLVSFFPEVLNAQLPVVSEQSNKNRLEKVQHLQTPDERVVADSLARARGMRTRTVFQNGQMMELRRFNAAGKPEYLITTNRNAAITTSTNVVWPGGSEGLGLDGSGLLIGVWDGGVILSTHQEFGVRVRTMNQEAEREGHATHVGGTIGASGINNAARGMASNVFMESYDWISDINEMGIAADDGLLLSNHSYGYLVGWQFDPDMESWVWWGDDQISKDEDLFFGYYHQEARAYDIIAQDHPYYLIVKSVGNDRGEGPEKGTMHFVWDYDDWSRSFEERAIDGDTSGFDCITPVSTAKNILTVGSVEDRPGNITNPDEIRINSFSSFGPTDDGRIKPDLLGNGHEVFSTFVRNNESYATASGTSMSTPNVTGSLVLLQQHYHQLHGEYLRASSLKGLALHTAMELDLPGPDYKSGWGLMNTASAARLISDTMLHHIQEMELYEGEEVRIRLYATGESELKATLCWTDPAGTVPRYGLDPYDKILVNDLDLRIESSDGLRVFKPWILNPVRPFQAAVTGDNSVDNVEQVRIHDPMAGYYDIVISSKGKLEGGVQVFSLISSGLTESYTANGHHNLYANNGSFQSNSVAEYGPGTKASWHISPENGLPVNLSFREFDTQEGKDILNIYDGFSDRAPLLASFSGNLGNMDTLIISTTGHMWISFTSDSTVHRPGFIARYCTLPPELPMRIVGEKFPCAGTISKYQLEAQNGTEYTWGFQDDWKGEFNDDGSLSLTCSEGEGVLYALPFNRCGTAPRVEAMISGVVKNPELVSIQKDELICEGKMSSILVNAEGSNSIHWDFPGHWHHLEMEAGVEFIPLAPFTSPVLSISNGCGKTDTILHEITVLGKPGRMDILSESDTICMNSPMTYFVDAHQDFNYRWFVNGDWEIFGSAHEDTVLVSMGIQTASLFLESSNICGSSISERKIKPLSLPPEPKIIKKESEFDNLPALEVDFSRQYRGFQWYHNGSPLRSDLAKEAEIVASMPGLYTVQVQNSLGCWLLLDDSKGIFIQKEGLYFSVHASGPDMIQAFNSLSEEAEMELFDTQGKKLNEFILKPGVNSFIVSNKGILLFKFSGGGYSQTSKILLY